MKAILLTILMFVLISIGVYADQGIIETYQPNELFNLALHLSDENGNVLGSNCGIQIRNNSFDVILNGDMNEINQGWYNFTFNTSQTGSYFCRQNCSSGPSKFVAETCDFIIEPDEELNKMTLAIIVAVLAVILFYLFLFKAFTIQLFIEHGAIKTLLLFVSMWLIQIPINIMISFNNFFLGPPQVSSLLNTTNLVIISINTLILFYFILIFLKAIVDKMNIGKGSGRIKT